MVALWRGASRRRVNEAINALSTTGSNEMKPLDQRCRELLELSGNQLAIEYERQWFNWDELRQTSDELIEILGSNTAFAKGKIALVARNRPSALMGFLALLAARTSIRMVYPFQSDEALVENLKQISPTAVVADIDDMSTSVLSALSQRGIVAIGLSSSGATLMVSPKPTPPRGQTKHKLEVAEEPTVEILTSGTTGAPKPEPLDYDFINREIAGAPAPAAGITSDSEDRTPALLMFPISNISGLYTTLPPLLSGQPIVLLERFTVNAWRDFVVRYRPTVSGMPPAGVQMVLDAEIPVEDLSSLKALGAGAAPLDSKVHRAFEARYGIPILLSYGATEFAGPVTRMTPQLLEEFGDSKHGSVGKALPGSELRVVDADSGTVLAANEEGLLEVITARKGNDWIRTSDLARIDSDGFLFILGRVDGAIIRGGFKILPATVEHALLQHPLISHAAVIAIPERRLGHVPGAVVECRSGAPTPALAELEQHVRDRLPATHIPKEWRIVDALPRTASMKVDLPAVRALFNSE